MGKGARQRKKAEGTADGQDAAEPERPASGRPVPWQVKAAAVVAALKASTLNVKLPYVFPGILSSVPGAGVFLTAMSLSTALGTWLRPRLVRRYPPSVTTWFQHAFGLASNVYAVIDPESLLPVLPGSLADSTFMTEVLLGGCAEQLQATEEEYASWGKWVRGAGTAASAVAPFVAPLLTTEMANIFYYCLAVDVLIVPLLFVFAMPKEQAPLPPIMSWAEMLRTPSLRTAPGRWLGAWGVAQALEHKAWELLVSVYVVATFSPSFMQVTLMMIVPFMVPYGPPISGFVQQWCGAAPRLVLLCVTLFLNLLRVAAFLAPSVYLEIVLVFLASFALGSLVQVKTILYTEFIAEKDDAPAAGISIQGTADSFVSVAAPSGVVVLHQILGLEALTYLLVLVSVGVVLSGQAGAALFVLPARGKSKEE